jgi:WhiB family transcriptional regulator, redox-sensing transcriptional regulator
MHPWARYAIVDVLEGSSTKGKILVLLDDEQTALEMARELRARGRQVVVQRDGRSGTGNASPSFEADEASTPSPAPSRSRDGSGIRSSSSGEEFGDLILTVELANAPPPGWYRDAACQDVPPGVTFFAERGKAARAAKLICGRCPVLDQCQTWALEQHQALEGIWGGLTRSDRARIRRESVA